MSPFFMFHASLQFWFAMSEHMQLATAEMFVVRPPMKPQFAVIVGGRKG